MRTRRVAIPAHRSTAVPRRRTSAGRCRPDVRRWPRARSVVPLALLVASTLTVGEPAADAAEGLTTATPPGSLAYVGDMFSDDVAVVDTGTGAMVASVPVGATALVMNGDRSLLFAASSVGVFEPGAVTPIDTTTNTALDPIPVGIDPRDLAITPDGRTLYVANANSDSVTPVDLTSMTPRAAIGVGDYPGVLEVTPDGRTLYVGSRNSREIHRIDTRTDTVVGTPIPVPQLGQLDSVLQSMAMSPDGSALYVDNGDRVMVLQTASDTFGPSIGVDENQHFGMAVSADGGHLVVTNFMHYDHAFPERVSVPSVQIIDLVGGTVGAPIPMAGETLGVSIDPGGTAFVVVRESPAGAGGTLVPIDLATGAVGTPIPTGTTGPSAVMLLETAPPPRIVPGRARAAEGDDGSHEIQVPVRLSGPTARTVTASWVTRSVPGATGQADPATDYVAATGTVTFAPGEWSATVPITVHGDDLVEPSEYIVVAFHHPTNARMGGVWGMGFATVVADDNVLTPGTASVAEGASGTAIVEVPVALSNPTDQPVTVAWQTVWVSDAPGDQASPGHDYTPASGTVTLAVGETAATVPVSVHGDTASEPDEYVVVAFHDPTNGVLGGFWGLGFVAVRNDD